jgi:hypothetical protein
MREVEEALSPIVYCVLSCRALLAGVYKRNALGVSTRRNGPPCVRVERMKKAEKSLRTDRVCWESCEASGDERTAKEVFSHLCYMQSKKVTSMGWGQSVAG